MATNATPTEPLKLRLARAVRIRARRVKTWSSKASLSWRRVRFRLACRQWAARTNRHRIEVLVGPNLAQHGGVRYHIHGLQKYSSQKVGLVPDDVILSFLKASDAIADFKKWFETLHFPAVRTVHSHVDPWFIHLCRKMQSQEIRWVHTFHLLYFPEHYRNTMPGWQAEINNALLTVARLADVRISVARWLQGHLANGHGLQTTYLPNPVDVECCDSADGSRFARAIRLEGFALYVGRNDPVKNPADFIRLATSLPGLQFVMIGQGLTREILRSEWQTEVPPNLLVYGPASRHQVQDAIAACGVVIVTSKREGLPTLVLEAMALRKPVVVPDEAGCMEAIGGGEFGYIYRQGDVSDLAGKTLAALADRQRGQRARERVLAEYDWRVVAPKLDAIYRGEAAAVDGGIA